MKNRLINFLIILAIVGSACSHEGYAQDAVKNRVRLKADYIKIMESEAYLNLKATSRIEKQTVEVSEIELTVFNELEEGNVKLGIAKTNMKGESRFVLKDPDKIKPDSTGTYNLLVSFEGDDSFKKASRSIHFKDAAIHAKLITNDSVNYISASLSDLVKDSLISGESLDVQVQRLFMPLKIGEEFNMTDENGTIVVPIEEGIPGVDGILKLEVVLNDHDEYGTVKALVEAPVGSPIIDESTFDQRTMWGPRNKTPIFILIFTNLLILGIWGIIIYLIRNLFKIVKL